MIDASVAQLVEHHVANVIVAGSTPVTRSIFFARISCYLDKKQPRWYLILCHNHGE